MIENNNIYIPDVKTIIGHLKSLKGVDLKEIKKNVHTLASMSPYIIQFYKTSGEISNIIAKTSNAFDKSIIDAQKFTIESLAKMIDMVNKINELKTPNFAVLNIKLWKLGRELDKISNIFFGRNGIVRKLSVFNILRSGGIHEEYDEKGNLKSKTTVDPFKPADVIKSFQDLVDVITDINDQTTDLAAGVFSAYALINLMWPRLIGKGSGKKQPGIINRYIELIKSKEFKYLQNADIESQLDVIGRNVESMNSIITAIISIDSKFLKQVIKVTNHIDDAINNIEIIVFKISDFSQIVKSKKFAGIKPQITTIKAIIDSILSLVKDIILLGLVLIPLTLAAPLALGTLWVIGGFIKTAIHVINWISIENDYETIATAVGNITRIVGLMLLMVGMVLAELILISLSLPILIKSADAAIITFAVIGLITYAIAWLALCIEKVIKGINTVWEGLLAIIGLIGVMLFVTGMLVLFAALASDFFTDNNWLMTLAMFGVVGVVTLAIAGLGYLIVTLLPGITAFTIGIVLVTISISAMILIGVELNGLANFNFDDEKRNKIKSSVAAIIGAATDVINGLFYGFNKDDNPNQPNNNLFVKLFKSLFKGASYMVEAFAASMLFVFTTISVTMMLLIGLELEYLTKINIDKSTVITNVNNIMGVANSVIDSVFESENAPRENTNGTGFFGALKHVFTGTVDLLETIIAVGKTAFIMISIAIIRLIGSELKWISDFDITNINGAVNNVGLIMATADSVIDAIFNPGDIQTNNDNGPGEKFLGFIKNTLGVIGNIVESVVGVGKVGITLAAIGMVTFLAGALKTINDISNEVKTQQILDNTDLILTVSDQIVKKVFDKTSEFNIDKAKVKSFNSLTNSLDKFIKVSNNKAENLERNIDNTIKFVDEINTIKIENLQTATNMFEKMADFSKSINGNFEGLADVIEEKIMPLLEKLNETFENTSKVTEGNTGAPAITQNAPAFVGTTSTQNAPAGVPATAAQTKMDYTSAISEIRQELSKIHEVLTDGSQVTRVDDR